MTASPPPLAPDGLEPAADQAALRLAELQRVTAALGSTLSVAAIGEVVVGGVATMFGAAAGALAVVEPHSGMMGVVPVVGAAEGGGALQAGGPLPSALGPPLAEVGRAGRALYLATRAEWQARYPDAPDLTAAAGEQALDGVAALPCIAGGELLGVVALGFRGPSPLVGGERALAETLATQCAQALYRARLLEAREGARAAAEAAAHHIAQIQRLTERVSTALTTTDVMRVVGEDVAGAVAGAAAAVYAARPTDGRLELVFDFGEQLSCEPDDVSPGAFVPEAAALAAEAVAQGRLLSSATPVAACVALPLGAGPNVVGALVLELRPPRALTPAEQDLLLAAGRIAAQGITRARLQSLREEERRRLARELHDEFGQTLTGLKFDLAYLAHELACDRGGTLVPAVRTMIGRVDAAADALRRIAAELRPGVLDDLGLVAALEWQAGELARRTGVPCTLEIALGAEVDEPVATAVFRVFQEALTNVARHARAGHVRARLADADDAIRLHVVDDGVGLPADGGVRAGAMGLVGMRERAAALGGTLTVGAAPGRGTEVRLELPYTPSVRRAARSGAAPTSGNAHARVFAPERPAARPEVATPAPERDA
jgi:signal transduction histidine kinase